jgi:hypothetical protein
MSSSNWKVLYSFKFATSNGGNYKMARVSKFVNEDGKPFVYLDIRNYNIKNNATKNGVCLKPEEFIWLIKRLQQKKRSGRLEKNNRHISIKKFGNNGCLLTLVTYTKTVTYGLEGNELHALMKRSREIITKLKYFPPPTKPKIATKVINNDDFENDDDDDDTQLLKDDSAEENDISDDNADDEGSQYIDID